MSRRQAKGRVNRGGMDWLVGKPKDIGWREHFRRAYRSFNTMWPKTQTYGLQYLYDYQYRSKCRKKEISKKDRRLYGSNFLNNRRKWRLLIAARDGWKCNNKECSFEGTGGMTMDHIIPVSMGGTTCLENLQFLCEPCHVIKSQEDHRKFNLKKKQHAHAN